MALTWPYGMADPGLYAYIMNAAASLSQYQHQPHVAPPPPPLASYPPPSPYSTLHPSLAPSYPTNAPVGMAPGGACSPLGLYASLGLQRAAAAAAAYGSSYAALQNAFSLQRAAAAQALVAPPLPPSAAGPDALASSLFRLPPPGIAPAPAGDRPGSGRETGPLLGHTSLLSNSQPTAAAAASDNCSSCHSHALYANHNLPQVPPIVSPLHSAAAMRYASVGGPTSAVHQTSSHAGHTLFQPFKTGSERA